MDEILEKVGRVFLPGDQLASIEAIQKLSDGKVKLGPGLHQMNKNIVSYKCGILKYRESPMSFWIDTNQKRYAAVQGDTVIGIITNRGTDNYKVDIGSSQPANLNNLAFEGATKRHKPNLKLNDLVFAKLILANKDMEPELSCIDDGNDGNGLGPLNGGYIFNVSLGLSRKLLELPQCKVLSLLGKSFPFEIIVGMNGRVWINSKGIIDTIAIANAIVSSEFMVEEQIQQMVSQLVNSIAGFNDDDDDDEEDDDEEEGEEGMQQSMNVDEGLD